MSEVISRGFEGALVAGCVVLALACSMAVAIIKPRTFGERSSAVAVWGIRLLALALLIIADELVRR